MLRFIRGSDKRTISFGPTYGHVWELAVDNKYTKVRVREDGLVAYHAAVAAAYDDGFALERDGASFDVVTGDPFVAMPVLERAVEAAPDDLDTWSVLADAWEERGDPRGPCIHMSRALANVTDVALFAANKRAAAAAHRLRASHLYGPLGRDAYRVLIEYKHGLPASLDVDQHGSYAHGASGRSTAEIADLLRANPFCRFVK